MTPTTAPQVRRRYMRGGRWLAFPIAVGLIPLTSMISDFIHTSLVEGTVQPALLPLLLMWWAPVLTALWWWAHPDAHGSTLWHLVNGFATCWYAVFATGLTFVVLTTVVG